MHRSMAFDPLGARNHNGVREGKCEHEETYMSMVETWELNSLIKFNMYLKSYLNIYIYI